MKRVLGLFLLLPFLLEARKFYDDDPLIKEPAALPIEQAEARELSEYLDFFTYTFANPAEKQPKGKKDERVTFIPAEAVDTLGEVPDSAWFTNRIGHRPMSLEELVRGPGDERPPSPEGKWTIVSAKTEGVTPGFMIKDVLGRRYIVKLTR